MKLKAKWDSPEGQKALDAWRKAERGRWDWEKTTNAQFKLAMERAQAYYGVGSQAGTIANGPNAGQAVTWDPEFLDFQKDDAGKYKKVLRETVGKDGGRHYLSTKNAAPDNAGGLTQADGKSFILLGTFVAAVQDPGVLAGALFHERFHFQRLTTTGLDNNSVEEKAAYEATLGLADTFEIPEDYKRAYQAEVTSAGLLLDAVKTDSWNKRYLRWPFPSAASEAVNKKEFGLQQSELQEIWKARQEMLDQMAKSRKEEFDRWAKGEAERIKRERDAQDAADAVERARNSRIPQSDLDAFQRAAAQRAWTKLRADMESMRAIVSSLCHDDALLTVEYSRHPMRGALARFAQLRRDYVQVGRNAPKAPGLVPFEEQWVFASLTGCELDAMSALTSKDPPLQLDENEADESWGLETGRRFRHVGNLPGSAPPSGSTGSPANRGSSVPTGLSGSAWSELNSWPHF